MSEPRDNFHDEQPRRTNAMSEQPAAPTFSYDYPLDLAALQRQSIKSRLLWLMGVAVCIAMLVLLITGLAIVGVTKTRVDTAQMSSQNNLHQMAVAMQNCATNTTNGEIPPSYGKFHAGNAQNKSFFENLLPYIECVSLYQTQDTTIPIKCYIASSDPYNPGTSDLISYGSNANLLTVGGKPTLSDAFGSRSSGVIVLFERTAKSGATWSGSNSYLFDKNGSSSPEFTGPDTWSNYGSKATALLPNCCLVGMGDGSVRIVTQSNAIAAWAWAMDPSVVGKQPDGW